MIRKIERTPTPDPPLPVSELTEEVYLNSIVALQVNTGGIFRLVTADNAIRRQVNYKLEMVLSPAKECKSFQDVSEAPSPMEAVETILNNNSDIEVFLFSTNREFLSWCSSRLQAFEYRDSE